MNGGLIAYYGKKQNVSGAIVLGLGNTIQAVMGVAYIKMVLNSFPHHLLSCLFSFASIVVMSLAIQKEKRNRLTKSARIPPLQGRHRIHISENDLEVYE